MNSKPNPTDSKNLEMNTARSTELGSRVTCTACNHQHPTMAVLWHDDETVTLLCHENDHSCYVDFVEQQPAEHFAEYVKGLE